MPEKKQDAPEAKNETPVKKTVRRPRAKKEESAPQAAPKKTPVKKSATAKKSAPKKESGLNVEEVAAKSSEEWSPTDSPRQAQSQENLRPRRERLDVVSEDIPSSYKSSEDNRPVRERAPERSRQDSRSHRNEEDNADNAENGDERNPRSPAEGASRDSRENNDPQSRNHRDNRQGRNDNRNNRQGRDDRHGRRDNRNNNRHEGRNDNRQDSRNDRHQQRDERNARPNNNQNLRNQNNRQQNPNNRSNKPHGQRPPPQLMVLSNLPDWEILSDVQAMEAKAQEIASAGEGFNLNEILGLGSADLLSRARELGVQWEGAPLRDALVKRVMEAVFAKGLAIHVEGVVDVLGNDAVLVFGEENYKVRPASPYLPKSLINKYVIERGTTVKVQLHPATEQTQSLMPMVLKVLTIMGEAPEANLAVTPFEELVPYYPTKRILLETHPDAKWDNFSMRITDLLTPIGFGQRGLIVAPPRTGKTILMQGMANAITENHPEAYLIVLLVDERPEEVTDFKRQIKGEVVSSTFDETPLSHVHAAEIVIEKARRMVERGQDVVILLDSITRLARAYNAMMPSSGKIMSGGVESNALQKPKRFFGSARNIEGGGSLTILGTALVDTGSKMDEVIFEEFKGTGNMELHLDRGLVDKRLFPAIALDKSGTRKEELLYHPEEMQKVYGLRRAMKGISPIEAMEMMLGRVKKTRTNVEFLMGLSR